MTSLLVAPRTVLYLKFPEDRILTIHVDVDHETLPWVNNVQSMKIFDMLKEAIRKDLQVILEKERGAIVVPGILSFDYELSPYPRKDQILLKSTLQRSEVFPYVLKIMLYPPNHLG